MAVRPAASSWRDQTALVTGASGLIGRALCADLAGRGARIYAITRDARRMLDLLPAGSRVRVLEADLQQPGAFRRFARSLRPACTFHLAAYGLRPGEDDPEAAERVNAVLPVEVGQEALAVPRPEGWGGLRFVHVGTGFAYGSTPGPLAEGAPVAPVGVYARSKVEGARRLAEALEEETDWLLVRPFTVWGPGEHPHRLVPSVLRALTDGEPVALGAGEERRSFVHSRDVATALAALAARPVAESVVHVAGAETTTVRGFVESLWRAGNAWRAQRGLEERPESLLCFGERPPPRHPVTRGVVDISRLEGLLDWSPRVGVDESVAGLLDAAQPSEA